MPALIQPAMANLQNLKRALSDPNTAAELISLIARKSTKKGKTGKKKIKGGAIAGIVIGVIVVIVVVAIILFLLRRQQRKKKGLVQQGAPAAAPAHV